MPIATPQRRVNSKSAAQAANFAKSLPIEIANSPLAVGRSYMATLESDEDVSSIYRAVVRCSKINPLFLY